MPESARVIATRSFAGAPAVFAVMAYGIAAVLGSLVIALWWGRQAAAQSARA